MANQPLLLDFGAVPECHCNSCLDDLFKALAADPEGRAESIWAPHENPMIRDHVEDVTKRLQRILQTIQDILARALTGEAIGELQKAELPWLRWDEAAFERTRIRLESKPTRRYTLEDWLLLVDYLLQRYLGDGVIQTEAEYLVVRAQLAGKIQANMLRPKPNVSAAAAAVAELVPTSFRAIPPKVLTPLEHQILLCAKEYAATGISNVTEQARAKMRTIIIEHVQAQVLGQVEGQYTRMGTRLFDEFGTLNRDFRRIAVTESGEACNTGFIAAQRPGAKVRRQEAYRGVCAFCKSINGEVFTVVDSAKPDKDGDTQVWVGKSNIGRSAAPRKRQGGGLVERPSIEMWWVASGVQHPHCRGSWLSVGDELPPGVSPEFDAWMNELLARKLGPAAPT